MSSWLMLGDTGTTSSPKQLDKPWHSPEGGCLTTHETKQDSAASCKISVWCIVRSETQKTDHLPSHCVKSQSLLASIVSTCWHKGGTKCTSEHTTAVSELLRYRLTAPLARSTSSKQTHEHTTWAAREAQLSQHSLLSFAVLR